MCSIPLNVPERNYLVQVTDAVFLWMYANDMTGDIILRGRGREREGGMDMLKI